MAEVLPPAAQHEPLETQSMVTMGSVVVSRVAAADPAGPLSTITAWAPGLPSPSAPTDQHPELVQEIDRSSCNPEGTD